jgi:hypothetical protein
MALRKTLDMLKRGEEINDSLYRVTTRERRSTPRPARAPMPWDRHLRLTGPLTESLTGRRLSPDAG